MDKKDENKVNLDTSVSEQIADMQLMYLRQAALNRVLSYDEIKTLEILTKVKNTEVEKRQPKEEDIQVKRTKELQQLAEKLPNNLLDIKPSKAKNANKKAD